MTNVVYPPQSTATCLLDTAIEMLILKRNTQSAAHGLTRECNKATMTIGHNFRIRSDEQTLSIIPRLAANFKSRGNWGPGVKVNESF
jgi:hypothetical protein